MTFFGEYRPNTVVSPFAHHGGHDEHDHAARDDHGHEHHAPVAHAAHEPAHHDAHAAHGAHDGHAHTPHESPWTILVALCVLATLGVFGGHFWLGDLGNSLTFWKHQHTWFEHAVSLKSLYGASAPAEHVIDEHSAHAAHVIALSVSLTVALLGILLAYLIYGRGWERSQRIAGKITGALGLVYTTVARQYFVDDLVGSDIQLGDKKRPLAGRNLITVSMGVTNALAWIDKHVVDGIVNLLGRTGRALGFGSAAFDRLVVDGAVNGVGLTTQTFGSVARLLQSGRVQQYATFAVFGGLALAVWLILL
jgi:NADH:ubiquinone oxidoreductase subunit 5 (subunit L)/multisubunit Na+/H+ antiporter MnhA subunit